MTLKQIALAIGLENDSDKEITGLNTLVDSNENELTFLENKKYINDLENTKAGAVLVKEEFASLVPAGTIALICEEPYLNLAHASKLFAPNVIELEGNDAIIASSSTIMENVMDCIMTN